MANSHKWGEGGVFTKLWHRSNKLASLKLRWCETLPTDWLTNNYYLGGDPLSILIAIEPFAFTGKSMSSPVQESGSWGLYGKWGVEQLPAWIPPLDDLWPVLSILLIGSKIILSGNNQAVRNIKHFTYPLLQYVILILNDTNHMPQNAYLYSFT